MTKPEEIVEKLKLHGYTNRWEEVNIEYEGLTYHGTKDSELGRLHISFHQEQQMGEPFWVFRLRRHVRLFPENKYFGAQMFVEIDTITEFELKYLPIFEKRLLEVNGEPIANEP